MNELALFAGAGGGILGGKLLGWRTVCAVEFDPYARSVLMARQNDGCLEPFPIWDDVRTFDGHPWRGRVDVVSGGFPCQDISVLNTGGDGLEGERSGLWTQMARIVGEVGPKFVFVENSSALTSRGLGGVLGDLAALGYDARWGVLGADDAGGPHRRERIWIVAGRMWAEVQTAGDCELCDCCEEPFCKFHADHYSDCDCVGPHNADEFGICLVEQAGRLVAHAAGGRLEGRNGNGSQQDWPAANGSVSALVQGCSWPDVSDPRTFGSSDGVANRVDRLKRIGNGQVPAVVRLAWNLLGPRNGGGVA